MDGDKHVVKIDLNEMLRQQWRWFRNIGIVMIVLGVLAIALPLAAALTIGLLLGWLLLLGGVVQAVHAFRTRTASRFWWELGIGVLYILAGLLFLTNLMQGIVTLTIILAILFLLEGCAKIVLALQLRGVSSWFWLLLSGLLALLLGVLLLADLPGSAAWALGLIVGINLVFSGFSLLTLAQAARRS